MPLEMLHWSQVSLKSKLIYVYRYMYMLHEVVDGIPQSCLKMYCV